jgi:hypothetical protein
MKYFPSVLAAALAVFSSVSFAADAPQRGGARDACKADVDKLCAQVKPGGGRIAACLKQNASQISEPCKDAISHMREQKKAGASQQ